MGTNIFHQERIITEVDRYFSTFRDFHEAYQFDAMQAEALTAHEITGEPRPHVVEYFIIPGKTRDTFDVNPDTLMDKWEVEQKAGIELQVVVFKNEEEKQLYLQSKTKN